MIRIDVDPVAGDGVVAAGVAAGPCEDVQPVQAQERISSTAHADQNKRRDCVTIVP